MIAKYNSRCEDADIDWGSESGIKDLAILYLPQNDLSVLAND